VTNQIHSAVALSPVQGTLTHIREAELDRFRHQTGCGGEEKFFALPKKSQSHSNQQLDLSLNEISRICFRFIKTYI